MKIKCEFIEYPRGYGCNVTKSAITKPNIDIVSFIGIHKPGKTNEDVIRIYFGNAKVEYFPRSLQKIFPNLNTLMIVNSGLKEICREDLIGLEKLESLNLSYNQLTSLPDDLFINMPNLKKVYLGHNKIEFASSKFIEPIVDNKLEFFELDSNTSIDECYWRGHNSSCKTIQDLMSRIDEKCKPPAPRMIEKAAKLKPPTPQIKPLTPKPQAISACGSHADEILKGFNKFRFQGHSTDFVIVVGSKEFPVHKAALATQSPVLAEMLFEVKTNGRFASKLEISEMTAEAVEAFLDYLYEQKLPDARNAVEIFMLAAKYEVAKLKVICEKIIHENLDESNAFEIFKLACGPHKSEELKVAAFAKLQEKFGGELNDDLIDNPEKLRKIVEAKKVLDELMKKS